MKHSALKCEPASGIIALAVLALLAGTVVMWALQHRAELEELHHRLSEDAKEVVRQIEVFDPVHGKLQFNEKCVPLDLRDRLLEVRSILGNFLYQSPRLATPLTADEGTGFYQDADGHRRRLEVLKSGGLVFYVNADLDPDDDFVHEVGGGLLLAVTAMFVIIVIGGLWLRDRALRPVHRIREGVARVTARSLERPLPSLAAPREITALVSTLNVTFKELHSNFEQTARFSADASHQLKTPLATLRLGVENLLTDPKTPRQQLPRIDELLNQIHRLTSIVERLLLLSRADAGYLGMQREEFNFQQLLSGFVDDISALAQENGITLETKILTQKPVVGDRDLIAIVLGNLMENAVKYNRAGGLITLVVSENARWIEITISNTGESIPPERAAHIFQRFFSAHNGETTSGCGLGLSIAQELVKANQGQLELTSSAGGWTEFRLRLPAGCGIG